MRSIQGCLAYGWIIMGVMQVSKMLLEQGYIKQPWTCHWKSSLVDTMYGDVIIQYEVPLSRLYSGILKLDNKQWHSTSIIPITLLYFPRGDVGVRIRPQHPLACRKRRLNGAACLPWVATRVAWGKDPGGWGFELTATSSGPNTPLWPLLVLDGKLNLARFNQSAGRAEPRDEWLKNCHVCHRQ